MSAPYALDPRTRGPFMPFDRPQSSRQPPTTAAQPDSTPPSKPESRSPPPSSAPPSPENDTASAQNTLDAETLRKTTIDWQTGAVVFRVIDEKSGQTISQNPDEALLRLRAYARQKEVAQPPSPQGDTQPQRTEKTA